MFLVFLEVVLCLAFSLICYGTQMLIYNVDKYLQIVPRAFANALHLFHTKSGHHSPPLVQIGPA